MTTDDQAQSVLIEQVNIIGNDARKYDSDFFRTPFYIQRKPKGVFHICQQFFYKLQTFFGRSWKQYGSRITTIQYVVESLKYFFLHFQKSLGCNHLTTFILIILDKSFQFTIIKNRNLNLYHNCFRKSWKRFFLTTRNQYKVSV